MEASRLHKLQTEARPASEAPNHFTPDHKNASLTTLNGDAEIGDDARRSLPSVDRVLQLLGPTTFPRSMVVPLVRRILQSCRAQSEIRSLNQILLMVRSEVDREHRSRLQPVINATGIVIHTNLGRAPLALEAVRALSRSAEGYTNLEYDLTAGERGSRGGALERGLAHLCGAQAAMVVNNCAAALVLVLKHFTQRRPEVIISRGELVQIGGGFRIPEILEASGAQLREVGTTNQTTLEDYAHATGSQTGLLLKVHRSNFQMQGFVASPERRALAALARKSRLPLVEDLGSGALISTDTIPGLPHEPTPAEVLKQGVEVVTFSGDKLFGGPQAGIIAGSAKAIKALKREPLLRALRCDKLILSALQATVDLYLNGTALTEVPVLALLRINCEELRTRAHRIIASLGAPASLVSITDSESQVGGGSLPGSKIPSVALKVIPDRFSVSELASRLRSAMPPVIGYVDRGTLKMDLRAVFPQQDELLISALKSALHG